MADEKLRITIEAEGGSADATLRELTDQIEALKREASETADELEGMDDAAEEMGDSAEAAGDSVEKSGDDAVTAKAKWDTLKEAAGYVKLAFEMTIGAAATLGDEMGDLADLTGQSVEEVSTMAATFELVGIKGDTLNKILKTLAQDGINLNMRELGTLAEKYQALKDPVEKNRFLFEHFGRAAGDMAEIMGRSKEELDRLTQAAENSGKVFGGEAADNAEEFNINLAIMKQRAEGAGISIGNTLMPTVNAAFVGFDNLVKVGGAAAIAFGQLTGAISDDEAAARAAALAAGDLGAGILSTTAYAVDLRDETLRLTNYTSALAEEGNGAKLAIDAWSASMEDAYPTASDLSSAIDHTSVIAAGLSMGMGELTKQTLFNQAAAGLDSLASLELARSMGLIDEEAYAAGTAVEELRQRYDTNHDGAITAAEGAAQFAREAANLARELNLIPTSISTTISVTKIGDENFGGWTAPAGSGGPAPVTTGNNIVYGGKQAEGGDYWVTRPTMFIAGEAGPERATFTPAGQTTNMGGVTINVSGAGDPQAVAREVSRLLAQQARGLTQSGAYMAGG